MIYDKNKEIAESEAWLERVEGYMSHEKLIYLTATGFDECTNACSSRDYSKDGMCACIREAFPTLEHYNLYNALSSEFGDLVLAKMFADLIDIPELQDSKNIGDK
jgi:hypothetical protein